MGWRTDATAKDDDDSDLGASHHEPPSCPCSDGLFALELTQHILGMFGTAMLRYRQGIPDRCEDWGSY